MHRIYVGTIGQGLWRSLDGGVTFTRVSEGMFVECHVRALSVHSHDPRILYLGSEQGLFRTSDGAETWTRVESPLNGKQIWSLLLGPEPESILVGVCPAQIFFSKDAGRTWIESKLDALQDCPRILWTRVTSFLPDPVQRDTIWAGVEIDGIHQSQDGGLTWQRVGQGLSSQDIHALAAVGHNGQPGSFLAATNNDLNRSDDHARSWKPLGIGGMLPWAYCRALAQPIGNPQVVLLGHGNGPPGNAGIIARSEDGGQTWKPARMPGLANSTIWNFAVHAADSNLIYASSVSGQLFRSWDQGQSWEKMPREFGEIRALAWAPE